MLTDDELFHAPALKLERAYHHINDLNTQLDAFLAEKPFKLMVHRYHNAGKTILRTKAEKPVPPQFGLIVGDAIHNMRAALDLTLFPMACDRADKPDRIQFPVAKNDTPKALKTAIEDGRVEFAGSKVVEAIERLNPSPTGNPDLWGIHALDARDKHRLPLLTHIIATFLAGSKSERILWPITHGKTPESTTIALTGEEGQDLLIMNGPILFPDVPDSEEEAEFQPSFTIAFSKGQPFEYTTAIKVLVSCAEKVASAVEALVNAYLDPENRFPP